ncbi:hypothetical protein PDENDC454_04184 [Paenibacillus dendritiformis C454]|uniref:Uncharacterized protein n=1 Tax=Paenibacillus dendritiformis C454 TaxID=1131935 RepID=H3SBF1_9BACL|nr:hypothetical protein [Paenibacillus dendritiformis]EHQ63634.1 hypothetical protein PDENDC454_04184 [Paenibacillus dendritiformis C454]
MKNHINILLWDKVTDTCNEIANGSLYHVHGAAKIQEAVEGYLKATDVAPDQVLTLGVFHLFIGEHPAALGDSVTDLIRFYDATKSKEAYKIVNRLTGETLLTNDWRFQIKKGE